MRCTMMLIEIHQQHNALSIFRLSETSSQLNQPLDQNMEKAEREEHHLQEFGSAK